MSQAPLPVYQQRLGAHKPGVYFAILLSILVAATFGFLYGAATWYNPSMKLRFILPIIVAVLSGFSVGYILYEVGHVRPREIRAVLGALLLLATCVGAWVGWLHAILGWETILINPMDYFHLISEIRSQGVFKHGKTELFKGASLTAVWIMESVALIMLGMIGAGLAANDATPHCWHCNSWTHANPSVGRFQPNVSSADLTKRLKSGDMTVMDSLTPLAPDAKSCITVTIYQCPACNSFATLNLTRQDLGLDEHGKTVYRTTDKITHLVIDPATAEKTLTLFPA